MAKVVNIVETKIMKRNGINVERVIFSNDKIVYVRLDNDEVYPKNVPNQYIDMIRSYNKARNRENEAEVERIMLERGYERSSVSHVPNSNNTNSRQKRKKAIAFILCIGIPLAALLFPFIGMYVNSLNEEMQGKLEKCLEKAGSVAIAQANGLTDIYDNRINCYNKYQVPAYRDEISKLENYKTEAADKEKLITCLNNVDKNYSMSEDEIHSAKTARLALPLLNRLKKRDEESISCYVQYGHGNYENEIAEKKASLSETESYIRMAELDVQNSNSNSNSAREPLHCTTNSIGSSLNTSCY